MITRKVYITDMDVKVLEDCYSTMVDNELDVDCFETRNLMKSLKNIIDDFKKEVENE